jgi:alkylation response protein AidB-like acyl-CoA dehydrogenase
MDFLITEEQKAFRDSVYKFSKNELHALTAEAEKKGEFCWEAWKKMGEYGIMALPFPEEYGGHDAGIMTTLLAMEALGHGGCDGGTCLAWGAHTILCGVPIWLVGTEEQKKKYLPHITSGQ